jgi:hypothetical protein
MVAPIFRFRNVKVRLDTNAATFIYGVVALATNSTYPDRVLAQDVDPTEVSSVLLTVQVSNRTSDIAIPPALVPVPTTVPISAYIQNATSAAPPLGATARTLVEDYPLLAKNAFDPLSGNLVMASGDQLWITAGTANVCDVVVSILEIANATAT